MTDIEICKKMCSLETSAKSRNIEFNLTFKKLRSLLKQKRCYFTGIEFTKDGKNNPDWRSIDRLDPKKGYTDDNVVAATVRINGKRADLTPLEIKQVYNGLKRKKMI
jgi:hypothetical protein